MVSQGYSKTGEACDINSPQCFAYELLGDVLHRRYISFHNNKMAEAKFLDSAKNCEHKQVSEVVFNHYLEYLNGRGSHCYDRAVREYRIS